jgi:uncharacterized membrane protein
MAFLFIRQMTDQPPPEGPQERVYFNTELRPHRSLGPSGFAIVMAVATGFGFVIGVTFMLIGAWPVFGFCGLEILLLYVAFRMNYRAGLRRERILLTDRGLRVRYQAPDGKTRDWDSEPNWMRITVDNPRRGGGSIILASHGRQTSIASFLTHGERTDLAEALESAIRQYRRMPFPGVE